MSQILERRIGTRLVRLIPCGSCAEALVQDKSDRSFSSEVSLNAAFAIYLDPSTIYSPD